MYLITNDLCSRFIFKCQSTMAILWYFKISCYVQSNRGKHSNHNEKFLNSIAWNIISEFTPINVSILMIFENESLGNMVPVREII